LLVVLTVGVVVLGGCGGQGRYPQAFGGPATRVTTTTTEPLPPIVHSVPLLALAKRALGVSETCFVSNPQNVRVVALTEKAAANLEAGNGGGQTQRPKYVIDLEGRFDCRGGDTNDGMPSASTSSTAPTVLPVSNMIVEVGNPESPQPLAAFLNMGFPTLSTLGRVYDLDPYIASLGGKGFPTKMVSG
jgi:hypothetical protein